MLTVVFNLIIFDSRLDIRFRYYAMRSQTSIIITQKRYDNDLK